MNYTQESSIYMLVCTLAALILGIVFYILCLRKKHERRFEGLGRRLYGFFHFKWLLSESLFKFLYLIAALFMTLYSFEVFFQGGFSFPGTILSFLGRLVIGNVLLRIAFEFLLALILLCRNTSEIREYLSGGSMAQRTSEEAPATERPLSQKTGGVVLCRKCSQPFDAGESSCPHCFTRRF